MYCNADATHPPDPIPMFDRLLKTWWLFVFALAFAGGALARSVPAPDAIAVGRLPAEARETLRLIRQGGPFPYARDGVVFGNYEGLLPRQKRGYYHEFTVRTGGARNRGARRIIVGGEPAVSQDLYYIDDHYATFKRIQE